MTVKSTYVTTLAAAFLLTAFAAEPAQPAAKAKPAGSTAPRHRIDILRWPAYQGATLIQQVSMSAKEIEALGAQVPADARGHLRGLKHVSVAAYRLPAGTPLRPIIGFYEPRVLAAGYKVLVKEFSDPAEVSAVYTGPGDRVLVLSAERDREEGGVLEIVAVEGPLDNLSAIGDVMKRMGRRVASPRSAASSRP
jgi:hypothetical protein